MNRQGVGGRDARALVERRALTTIGSPLKSDSAQRDTYPVTVDPVLLKVVASDFVDEHLLESALGVDKSDPERAADLFMSIPTDTRPDISRFFSREFYLVRNAHREFHGADAMLDFVVFGYHNGCDPHPFIDLAYITEQRGSLAADPCNLLDLLKNVASPSPYFDPIFYSDKYLPTSESVFEAFVHFLSGNEAMPNPYIDPGWYSLRYGDVAAFGPGAAAHFVSFGDGAGRRPSVAFDPEWYRNYYLDLDSLNIPPLMHFLKHGHMEGRLPNPTSSRVQRSAKSEEAKTTSSIAAAVVNEDADHTYQQYTECRSAIADIRQRRVERFRERRIDYIDTAHNFDLGLLAFAPARNPKITVLIPCFNEFEYTYECLLSLAASLVDFPFQIIIADDASTDVRVGRFGTIPHVDYVRQERNVGFLRNCNLAFARAQGEFVFLLNNDTQVSPDTLSVLTKFLDADPGTGAVGPMLLYPNGRLQEAGCRIQADGSTTMIGLFEDPLDPVFSYSREVDYCSGAALMLRSELLGQELFDEEFAPAYCEDVDLCLRVRASGFKIAYVPSARVLHHLSVSTGKQSEVRRRQLAITNQDKLLKRWGPSIASLNSARVIAFYLPQFHPVKENDLWWGKGFTEWRNVTKAKPCFDFHYQPHLPADLGYYDLRITEVMGEQYKLATRYGIEGFCVYYYNFNGKRVLNEPMERLLADKTIDFRYCLCWANENWTKHWDGGEKDILLAQDYTEDLFREVAADAARFADDPRQIRVDGAPVFLIYRPTLIPNIKEAARIIREVFKSRISSDVRLIYVESMETVNSSLDPRDIGFDASVQFPPQGIAVRSKETLRSLVPDWDGHAYDFGETIINDLNGNSTPYIRYPGAFFSWDNTPRQSRTGSLFRGVSPDLFQAYFEAKLKFASDMLPEAQRFVFINAWNEWAEGAHLEPDQTFGHRWLEAVRGALQCTGLQRRIVI